MSGLRERIWRAMEAHGLGWIDNGKPDLARCYCGYRPQRLGESWQLHVTGAVIEALGLREERKAYTHVAISGPIRTDRSVRYVTDWKAAE